MNNPKVSIIVPCYNVEKFVAKCIRSIMRQSYRNIEIIAVEDGSTDNTPSILNEIALEDDRLAVIHKKNGGVSAARNTGIEKATGQYIVFVDGDDYISNDYVTYMLKLVYSTQAEFCVSLNYFKTNKDKQIKVDNVRLFSVEDATSYFLSPDTIVYSPNCIINKDLIIRNKISFSTNLFYGEGLTFTSSLAQVCNGLGVGCRKVYYYRRNNETSATTKFSLNKYINGSNALQNIYNSLTIKTDKTINTFKLHLSIFYIGAIVQIKSHKLEKQYQKEYNEWRTYVYDNMMTLLLSKNATPYRKTIILLGYFFPSLLAILDIYRRKCISNKSVK